MPNLILKYTTSFINSTWEGAGRKRNYYRKFCGAMKTFLKIMMGHETSLSLHSMFTCT